MRDPALELARCIFASPASPDESESRGQAFPRILIPEESNPSPRGVRRHRGTGRPSGLRRRLTGTSDSTLTSFKNPGGLDGFRKAKEPGTNHWLDFHIFERIL